MNARILLLLALGVTVGNCSNDPANSSGQDSLLSSEQDSLHSRAGHLSLESFVASDAKFLGSPVDTFKRIPTGFEDASSSLPIPAKPAPSPFFKPPKTMGHILLKKVKAPKVKKLLAADVALVKKKVATKKLKVPKLKKLPLALKPLPMKPKVTQLEPIVHVVHKPVPVYHKVPVPKKVMIPKFIPIPKPIPVPKIIPVPYKVPVVKIIPKIVKIPKAIPVPKFFPVKKPIPIGIPVPVPKIKKFPVLKPVPYIKPIPIPFPKPVPKFVPVPVKKVIKVPKPYYVPFRVPHITKSYVKMPTVVPVPSGKNYFQEKIIPSMPKAGIPNFGMHFGSGKSAFGKPMESFLQQHSTTTEETSDKSGEMDLDKLLSLLESMEKGS